MDEITQALLQNLLKPKKVEVDGQVVEQHTLGDQIALAKYLASAAAVQNSASSGLKITKMQHSGAQ